jgi:hypothetical protein
MWFYLGIFTTFIAIIIRLHQKTSLHSALQDREKGLIPVHGKYKYNWSDATDKSPACGLLEIPCSTSLQFSAKLEREFDKWAKFAGLSYECQIGEKHFDERIYLSSITQDDADLLGQQPDLSQKIILALQTHASNASFHPSSELICDGQHLFLKLSYPANYQATKDHFINEKLPILQSLANILRQQKGLNPHFWKVPHQRNAAVVLALSSALAVVGGLEFIRFFGFHDNELLHPWDLAPYALATALIGATFIVIFCLTSIKVCARRHLILAEICIVGFPGLAFACYGWMYDANIRLDHGPYEARVLSVTDKYSVTHRIKNGKYHTYHLVVSPTLPPLPNNLSISSQLYNHLEKNDLVKVSIKSGFLHHPWLEKIEKVDRPTVENSF